MEEKPPGKNRRLYVCIYARNILSLEPVSSPNKNPLPVQRWQGAFCVSELPSSETRCLPMVPSLVGEGTGAWVRSARWLRAVL